MALRTGPRGQHVDAEIGDYSLSTSQVTWRERQAETLSGVRTVPYLLAMREVPANALRVGRLPRATIPEPSGQIPVRARIVGQGHGQWMPGTARAWTRDAVCVWWTDVDCLQRIDWLPAGDVQRV